MHTRNSILGFGKLVHSQYFTRLEKCVLTRSISTSSPRSNRQLNLTDMPRRLVPNPLELWKCRLQIMYNMFTVDKSFRYGEFSKGATQVKKNQV
jgi:hypothetical protein